MSRLELEAAIRIRQDLFQPNFKLDKTPEAWLAAWIRRTYA
jgi:hypothetical protein